MRCAYRHAAVASALLALLLTEPSTLATLAGLGQTADAGAYSVVVETSEAGGGAARRTAPVTGSDGG